MSADEFEKAKCVVEQWEINDADLSHVHGNEQRQRWAEKMCEGCPLIGLCAEKAIEYGSSGTVWAGTYIPDFVYGRNRDWQHRLILAKETNAIPTEDDVRLHRINNPLPTRFWVMNKPMAAGINRSGKHANPEEYCRSGLHKLTPENTYAPPKRPTVRECRECIKRRKAARVRNTP